MKFLLILLFTGILFSCKQAEDIFIEPIKITHYEVLDSMKLDSSILATDSNFYRRYNNKIFKDSTTNVLANFIEDSTGISLLFKDTNVTKGNTLVVKFAKKNIANINGTYIFPADTVVKFTQLQNFYNITINQPIPKSFLSGSVQISYNPLYKTLSGVFTNAKIPFGVYVPYQAINSSIIQTANQVTTLVTKNSNRTYNIEFNFINQ
jgi:hypothetical protein